MFGLREQGDSDIHLEEACKATSDHFLRSVMFGVDQHWSSKMTSHFRRGRNKVASTLPPGSAVSHLLSLSKNQIHHCRKQKKFGKVSNRTEVRYRGPAVYFVRCKSTKHRMRHLLLEH